MVNKVKKLVLATGNRGKVTEMQRMLQGLTYDIISQQELGVVAVAETGHTFVENALIKARNVCVQTGLPALADDSGLVVAALQGRPGIHSARYAGDTATDVDNITLLLKEMTGVEWTARNAYFYCVLALMRHADDPAPILSCGQWQGHILLQPQGTQGFGYDPVFHVEKYQCSAAELTLDLKNQISHRGIALQQLKPLLEQYEPL